MYIPPAGLFFRLQGHHSHYFISSSSDSATEISQTSSANEDDTLFSLIHSTDQARIGTYAIKGKASGKVLFSRNTIKPAVGHIVGDGYYNDNWFSFDKGEDDYPGTFRIVCPHQQAVLFSRLTQEPLLGNYPARGTKYQDQYFSFVFEDMVVKSVDYDLKGSGIIESTSITLADQNLTNNTDTEQEMSFGFDEKIGQTSKFEYSVGFTVADGTKIGGGIPFVVNGKISLDLSVKNIWHFGKEDSFDRTYTAHFPVRAGPHQTVHAISTIQHGVLKVPYTMTLASKRTGVEVKTSGTWRGVSTCTWNLHHEIDIV